jgi:hypothetical protein
MRTVTIHPNLTFSKLTGGVVMDPLEVKVFNQIIGRLLKRQVFDNFENEIITYHLSSPTEHFEGVAFHDTRQDILVGLFAPNETRRPDQLFAKHRAIDTLLEMMIVLIKYWSGSDDVSVEELPVVESKPTKSGVD